MLKCIFPTVILVSGAVIYTGPSGRWYKSGCKAPSGLAGPGAPASQTEMAKTENFTHAWQIFEVLYYQLRLEVVSTAAINIDQLSQMLN